MNKIAYVTHMRLPTEKAYGVQMTNTMQALAAAGAAVTLITTYNRNSIREDLYAYYQIPAAAFARRVLWSLRWFRNTRVGFWLNMLSFAVSATWHIIRHDYNVIYSREPFPLLFLTGQRRKTFFEMHDFPHTGHFVYRMLCRRVSYVVGTNQWALDQCHERYGVPRDRLMLLPNGYKSDLFESDESATDARTALGLPTEAKIVLYSGHLYDWKGADVIGEVSKQMPEVTFVFVGGLPEDQAAFKKKFSADNVILMPHQKPTIIPRFLRAADVLVLPNVPLTQHSRYSTSPIKLFEYMASGRPVIASRLPSIESVVSDKEVTFVIPGDIDAWAANLKSVVADPSQVNARAAAARTFVKKYSWESKAAQLLKRM